jgi:hypothetical protein
MRAHEDLAHPMDDTIPNGNLEFSPRKITGAGWLPRIAPASEVDAADALRDLPGSGFRVRAQTSAIALKFDSRLVRHICDTIFPDPARREGSARDQRG